MQLSQVRATLETARAQFAADPTLRRAFTHGLTAIDRWLERPAEPHTQTPTAANKADGR